jgi:hypothetical protein
VFFCGGTTKSSGKYVRNKWWWGFFVLTVSLVKNMLNDDSERNQFNNVKNIDCVTEINFFSTYLMRISMWILKFYPKKHSKGENFNFYTWTIFTVAIR